MNRQRRMKTLAVLLVFGMLLSWMPAGVISLPAQATTDAAGATAELSPSTFQLDADCQLLQYVDEAVISAGNHVARLKEKETLSTYVFLNADGTQTVYYMDENVKFVDSTGAVREKDISLTATRSGFATASNDVALSLPSDLNQGIGLSYGGYDVTMIPENISTATVQQQDGKIAYLNCYGKGTGLIYTPTLSGLKEDILLSAYTGVNSFSFLLNTDGLRPYTDAQGRYYFATSANADYKLKLADIVAFDANARFSLGSVTITPITMGQQYRLTVTVDEEFLTAETTAYPVLIDPTIEVSDDLIGGGSIEDATVYSNQLTLNTGTWPYNHAGYYDSTYGTGRVVYRLSGLLEDAAYQSMSVSEIDSAILYLTEATGSASAQVNLYAFTSNSSWSETNITWNTMGTSSDTIYAQGYLSYNQTTTFDITNMVKEWKNGTLNGEHGFSIRLANESAASKGVIASEYSVASKRPYVVVTYSAPEFASGYYLISQGENSNFLTPGEISYADGTGVDILGRSDEMPVALSQIWKVVYQGSGRYTISAIYKENLYMTANSNSAVLLSANPSGSSHLWTFEENNGVYTIKSCAFSDRVLTGTDSNEGIAIVFTYSENLSTQSWRITPTTPQGMMLLDSETGERRDAAGYYDVVAMYHGQTKTLSDLGLDLCIFDPYNSSNAIVCTMTNTSVASFNMSDYSIYGLGTGYTAVRVLRTINGTLYEVIFSLQVRQAVEVVVLYDQGYEDRYGETAASGLIISQMDDLVDFYLTQFGLVIQYTTPAKFQSVADTCGSYNSNCAHTTNLACIDALALGELTDCHHKNAYRILHSLPTYSNKKVLSFIGHNVCHPDNLNNHAVNGDGNDYLYGLAKFNLQAAIVMDHSEGNAAPPTHSISVAIHEFGHLFGAQDHYGVGETESLNQTVTDGNFYNNNCVYGYNKDEPSVYPYNLICNGCRKDITDTLNLQ